MTSTRQRYDDVTSYGWIKSSICHTDELESYLYEIVTVRISYGWVNKSFLWHNNNISMQKERVSKSFVSDINSSHVIWMGISTMWNDFDIISYGRVTKLSTWDSTWLKKRCAVVHLGRRITMPGWLKTTWWRNQMEIFSALLAICARNSPVSGEFPTQRPVTRSFDVFFDLCLNKHLSKQLWDWWFETLPRPLWRHSNEEHA